MDTSEGTEKRIKKRGCSKIPCNKGALVFSVSITLILCQFVVTDFYSLVTKGRIKTHPILQVMTTYFNISSFNNGKAANNGSNYKDFVNVGNGKLYIYSAVAEQAPTGLRWTSVVFSGYEHREASSTKYRCCHQYLNGTVRSSTTSSKRLIWNKSPLVAKQIVCNITNMPKPDLTGLVLVNESCKTDAVYRQPVYRSRHETPKFAICAKIAYGNKDPRELVEWMEYHVHFGASAVVIYPYEDLNPDAVKVLRYYARRGVLEMVPLPRVPLLDIHRRRFEEASHIKDQDEQVPNYDAQERLLPYTYYTIMDTDEFIVPRHENISSFVHLMEYLLKKFPDAGTFEMLTEVHLRDWERTNNSTDLLIEQHGYHTEPSDLTVKSLHVTDRVVPGTVWIHGTKLKRGFRRYVPDPGDVVLKHYRYCKPRWFRSSKEKKPCTEHFKKIRGHFMDNVAKIIGPKISAVMEYLQMDLKLPT